jgi:hypothetical protein
VFSQLFVLQILLNDLAGLLFVFSATRTSIDNLTGSYSFGNSLFRLLIRGVGTGGSKERVGLAGSRSNGSNSMS